MPSMARVEIYSDYLEGASLRQLADGYSGDADPCSGDGDPLKVVVL